MKHLPGILAAMGLVCTCFCATAQVAGNAGTTVIQSPDGSTYVHTGNVTINQSGTGHTEVVNSSGTYVTDNSTSRQTATIHHHHHHKKVADAHGVKHTATHAAAASPPVSSTADTATTSANTLSQTSTHQEASYSSTSGNSLATLAPAAPANVVVNTNSGPAGYGDVSVQTGTQSIHVSR